MVNRLLQRVKRSLAPVSQDLRNIIRYGRKGPIMHERIWIDPRQVRRVAAPHPVEAGLGSAHPEFQALRKQQARARALVGKVIGNEIDAFQLIPLRSLPKIEACRKHWQKGLSWEDSGAIEALMVKIAATGLPQSGCRTREDVVRRYQRLDEIFARVRAENRLASFARRKVGFMRALDEVQIHLGRDGELLFGEHGTHRLGTALVLGFERIPASLGFVHQSALDMLPRLRRTPAL